MRRGAGGAVVVAALMALAAGQVPAAADGASGGTGTPSAPGTGGARGTQGGTAAPDAPEGPTAYGGPTVWQPSGTPLPGTGSSADAPAMAPAVTYRDIIEPGRTKSYSIVLDARSSAYVSAFAVPPTGSRTARGDGIELDLLTSDGSSCGSARAHFDVEGDPRPIGTAVSRQAGAGSSCDAAGRYVLRVHRTTDGTSDPALWPLELRYVAEPPLEAGASPAPAPSFAGGSPAPSTAGTAHRAYGGPGFEAAAALRTGIWQDDVLPGETRFYKIPVDWGQRATVLADFSGAVPAGDAVRAGSGARLDVYSPVREFVAGDATSSAGGPASLGEQLAPAAYANRAAGDQRVAKVRYAGWYYLAVTVRPRVDGVVGAAGGAVPVTLRIDVEGSVRGAPAYDGNPRAAGIGIDAQEVAAANGTAGGAGSPSPGALRFAGFAFLGAGTVLLLSLAGWYAAAWRRPVRGARGAGGAVLPEPEGGAPPAR